MSIEQNSQASQQNNASRKLRHQLSSTQVMFAVILAIALMLAVQFSSRISDERTLNDIRVSVEQEIDNFTIEQADLIAELAFVQSDAYVEEWARGEGRMVREDMVLVIPKPPDSPVEEPATATQPILVPTGELETTLPEPEPWQLWWALFFDFAPPQSGF